MTTPIGAGGSTPSGVPPGGTDIPPPGPPLPPDDPWVKALAILFPNVAIGELQLYAGKFRDNMFQALNNQIQSDLKKARAAAKKLKDAIEGND